MLCPEPRGEPMRRRFRAGSEPVKTRHRKTVTRRNAQKAARRCVPSATDREKVARLTRELKEAHEHQTATGEIIASIAGSIADAKPVFNAIARNLRRLFDTRFVVVEVLKDGNGSPGGGWS
jgi:hypothetical protein